MFFRSILKSAVQKKSAVENPFGGFAERGSSSPPLTGQRKILRFKSSDDGQKQEVISKTPSPPPFYDGNFDDDPYGILRTNTGSNKFTLGKPQVKENKKSSTLDSPAIKEKGKSPKLGTS